MRKDWNMNLYLEYPFGDGAWRDAPTYQQNKDDLELNYARGPAWPSVSKMVDYYWIESPVGYISLVIECDVEVTSRETFCTQNQFVPYLSAVLKIKYRKEKIRDWKLIKGDVERFLNERVSF